MKRRICYGAGFVVAIMPPLSPLDSDANFFDCWWNSRRSCGREQLTAHKKEHGD
jgi:hypothetical protein